jgi:hypothetical protein
MILSQIAAPLPFVGRRDSQRSAYVKLHPAGQLGDLALATPMPHYACPKFSGCPAIRLDPRNDALGPSSPLIFFLSFLRRVATSRTASDGSQDAGSLRFCTQHCLTFPSRDARSSSLQFLRPLQPLLSRRVVQRSPPEIVVLRSKALSDHKRPWLRGIQCRASDWAAAAASRAPT